MEIVGVPFGTIDWSLVPESAHPGEAGVAYWRTLEAGNIRVRMVRYTGGYRADHWCSRGHVLLVLDGELVTEVMGGAEHTLRKGMSYHVGTNAAPHRSRTDAGAVLFIVD